MNPDKTLSLEQVIHRSTHQATNDIQPLLKYLDYEPGNKNLRDLETANNIAAHLRRMGSNDIATLLRGGEGVPYAEIVIDVAKKLGATGASEAQSVEQNETKIVEKIFADTLNAMSIDERRVLFQSMNLNVRDLPKGLMSSSALVIQQVIRQFGGFSTYRLAVVMANLVSKALLGTSLSFATNVAVTRTVGTLLGPIGWIATGSWLAVDLAGPAFRKTVPAVLYVAMLRQMLLSKVSIGVVGGISTGKDSLIQQVFKVPTNPSFMHESTEYVNIYPLGNTGTASVINFSAFNDHRAKLSAKTEDLLNHIDLFILVADINDPRQLDDQQSLEKLRSFGKPVLICLNKWDCINTAKEEERRWKTARERFHCSDDDLVKTSMRPPLQGCGQVFSWVIKKLESAGKSSVAESLVKSLGRAPTETYPAPLNTA